MKYCLNKHAQQNGDHEIHKEICPFYQLHKNGGNFIYLGIFKNEHDALSNAKRNYPHLHADGCFCCCKSIHKQ